MSKGVVSPWARRPVEAVALPSHAQPLEEYDNVPRQLVTLEGQRYKLHLPYLPCKDREPLDDAAVDFGACLTKLVKVPAFNTALTRQSLGLVKPLGPKVTFTFGDVTLYAVASTRELDLAMKMAIDRLCMALAETRTSPVVRKMLDDAGISISAKT